MKYLPARYNLFDDLFYDFFNNPLFIGTDSVGLKTDIIENEDSYQLNIEVPGFKKDDIIVKLKNEYLSINAKKDNKTEETDKEGNIIRRERYTGSMSRSYFVGKNVLPEDIKVTCTDGILKVDVKKKENIEAIEDDSNLIMIE